MECFKPVLGCSCLRSEGNGQWLALLSPSLQGHGYRKNGDFGIPIFVNGIKTIKAKEMKKKKDILIENLTSLELHLKSDVY